MTARFPTCLAALGAFADRPRGRHTAQPRTTTRAATETASAAASGCVSCPPFSLPLIAYVPRPAGLL